MTQKEIAFEFGISVNTVGNLAANAYERLGVPGAAAAVHAHPDAHPWCGSRIDFGPVRERLQCGAFGLMPTARDGSDRAKREARWSRASGLQIQGSSIEVATIAQAVALLGYSGDAKNGIDKLYGQLLAAQLNVVNPGSLADLSAVAATIVDAEAFLVTHDATSWAALSSTDKAQVLGWVAKLDSYNNGLIGPGHCS